MPKKSIAQPPKYPIIGNLLDMDSNTPTQSLMKIAKNYGPFFLIEFLNFKLYVACSQKIINELCDEERFEKCIDVSLEELRVVAGDGLFTAHNNEPNWILANRILSPSFSPIGVQKMFNEMSEIIDQMLLKWERFGSDFEIDVADNMTRLTLDTIALSAFNYRFNSFYRDGMHPFVDSMMFALSEASNRSMRPEFLNKLLFNRNQNYLSTVKELQEIASKIVTKRREDPEAHLKKDLLSRMLNGKDPITGEQLSDDNVSKQIITFLVAGHETTSGLLTFTIYFLLKNPDVLKKAREIVDEVLGEGKPRLENLSKLGYLDQILKESLRLWPTASIFAVTPKVDTILSSQYPIKANDTIYVLLPLLHRDSEAWGEDVEIFRPERFNKEEFLSRPPNSWKPFGNGKRACIGQAFAMQEALLALASILQNFDLELVDPNYELKVKETLTLKPENLKIYAKKRPCRKVDKKRNEEQTTDEMIREDHSKQNGLKIGSEKILILFGSNTGTSELIAEKISEQAIKNGYHSILAPMDEYSENFTSFKNVIIVTSSYEGKPPRNARKFMKALENLQSESIKGMKYAIFGCGNTDWAHTYQAVPKLIDNLLKRNGGMPILERGEGNARDNFMLDFESWNEKMWKLITLKAPN